MEQKYSTTKEKLLYSEWDVAIVQFLKAVEMQKWLSRQVQKMRRRIDDPKLSRVKRIPLARAVEQVDSFTASLAVSQLGDLDTDGIMNF